MHGVARVMVKDYGSKRVRELRRMLQGRAGAPKVDHSKELKRLIHDSKKYGVSVVMGGSQDGPVH